MEHNVSNSIRQHVQNKKFNQLIKNNNNKLNNIDLLVPNIAETTNSNRKLLPSIDNIQLKPRLKSHSQKRICVGQSYQTKKTKIIANNRNKDQSLESAQFHRQKINSKSHHHLHHKISIATNNIIQISNLNLITTNLSGVVGKVNGNKNLQNLIQQLSLKTILHIKLKTIQQNYDYTKFMKYIVRLKEQNRKQEAEKILSILQKLRKFIDKYEIISGLVQCSKLIQLSSRQKLSNYEMLSMFNNFKQLIKIKKNIPGLSYYMNDNCQHRAALKIQSYYRMVKQKQFYHKLKSLMKKVQIIQKYWRSALKIRAFRRRMMQAINEKISKHNRIQQKFINDWVLIKTSSRVEVHICSYSFQQFKRITMNSTAQNENSQIMRIFRVIQTDVHVIYVTPVILKEEIIQYYEKIMKFENINFRARVTIITPENLHRFADNMQLTTTSLLLYSPKALKRIKTIIGNRYGYLIPCYPSIEYINLSAELNIPILSSHQNHCKIASCKSSCKEIFRTITNSNKSPAFQYLKSINSLYSQKQMIRSFAVMISKNKNVKLWFFKIEDQINSRGLAYLKIKSLPFARKLQQTSNLSDNLVEVVKIIADQLEHYLAKRLVIVHKNIYSSYQQYLSHFLTRGGTIQASPLSTKNIPYSISFFIQPQGDFKILMTYHKLESAYKSVNKATKCPASEVTVDFARIVRQIYKYLYIQNKMFGFFTIDLLYEQQTKISFAIGLDCFLNEKTCPLFLAQFCTNSKYNKQINYLERINQSISYFSIPTLNLPGLPHLNQFFKNCKFNNIFFDLQRKLGTMFILMDQLQYEQIGILCLLNNLEPLLIEMKKLIQFLAIKYRNNSNHLIDQIGQLKSSIIFWERKCRKVNQVDDINLSQLF